MVGYKSSLNNPVFPYGISLSSQQQSRSLLPCSKSEHSEQFILHDGPPYANGEIHLGHALNKILKDITVRFEKLRGKDCSFIPGWDCHGLPIELSAMGVDLSLPPNQIRSASLTWATKCMQSQRLAFGEFNLLVDWSSVYSTLDLSYQSVVLKAFRDLCLKLTGAVLQDCAYAHPLRSSSGKYFLRAADFVVNKGTGFVHVAPAHGRDDFDFAKRHNLPLKNYVDEKACFTKDAGQELAGLSVQPEGTAASQSLFPHFAIKSCYTSIVPDSTKKMRHSFPYEWRTNKPVITRLSEQWFIDTDKLCEPAKMAYATVKVFPPDLKSCMIPFIENRPFWCISRQRIWGVPIPVLYRKGTLSPIVDPEFITSIADRVSAEGSEFWWSEPIDTMVPKSFLNKWSLSPKEIVKGTDIFDVWFESGLSWRAVLPIDCRSQTYSASCTECPCGPHSLCCSTLIYSGVADVYLEGYDQFRGWFSSSLLLGVALTGQAPFKTLVVHGFTTDAEGRKMSKSLGNVLAPKDLLKLTDNCSDVLRRWAAASGLSTHSSVSTKEFIDHATSYKKLRNAFRFMLGNLHDFTPDAAFSGTTADDLFHFLLGRLRTKPPVNFCVLDTWALCLVGTFMDSVLNSYFPNFKFETIIAELDRLVSRLSATYFNSVKDSLYCDPARSSRRQLVQNVLWLLVESLKISLVPIFPTLAEEVELSQKSLSCTAGLFSTLEADLLHRVSRPRPSGLSQAFELLRALSSWTSQGTEIMTAVSIANHLRHELCIRQRTAEAERPLWPGPVTSPLSRLHISLQAHPDDPALKALQVRLLGILFRLLKFLLSFFLSSST
ncbi:unnamed protein product [Schistocephalus solidus]|uniref:Isoleucyl-tRNA synthetase n=1 Tax=Schistocephalus solidus TaxID=70667 RepID=A0A183SZC8_SCHSO|nr:unnamed protein product [Schistocephalus solidus]